MPSRSSSRSHQSRRFAPRLWAIRLLLAMVVAMMLASAYALWLARTKADQLAQPDQYQDFWFVSTISTGLGRLYRATQLAPGAQRREEVRLQLELLESLLRTDPNVPRVQTVILDGMPNATAAIEQVRRRVLAWRATDSVMEPAAVEQLLQSIDTINEVAVQVHLRLTASMDEERIELQHRFGMFSWVMAGLFVGATGLGIRLRFETHMAIRLSAHLGSLNHRLERRVQARTLQLQEGRSLLTFILDSSPSEVALLRVGDGKVHFINRPLLDRLGHGSPPAYLPLPSLVLENGARQHLSTELEMGGHLSRWEVVIAAPQPYWASMTVQLIEVGGDLAYLVWAFDIAEQKALEDSLRNQASTDVLTGIPNRRALIERGELLLRNCQRYGHHCTALILDIDHFKRINDSFGHDVGDRAIRMVAAILKANMREVDLTARLGGEEFAAVMPNTDLIAAKEIAERLLDCLLKSSYDAGKHGLQRLTASIGVAALQEDGGTLQHLLHLADQALYEAKSNGRNRVCVIHQQGPSQRREYS